MVTVIGSSPLFDFSACSTFTMSIGLPSWTFGKTTMKMMRSTKTTSTNGVTLMLGMAPLAFAPVSSGAPMGALQMVDELARGVLHHHVESLEPRRQGIEREDGRDRDDETHGRDDERFRDPGGDRPDPATAGGGDALEGRDDADDGAEQADERRGGAGRGQDPHAATRFGGEQ